jgi:hypothetical protein
VWTSTTKRKTIYNKAARRRQLNLKSYWTIQCNRMLKYNIPLYWLVHLLNLFKYGGVALFCQIPDWDIKIEQSSSLKFLVKQIGRLQQNWRGSQCLGGHPLHREWKSKMEQITSEAALIVFFGIRGVSMIDRVSKSQMVNQKYYKLRHWVRKKGRELWKKKLDSVSR